MNINAATFNYFRLEDGKELLARIFLIEPSEVELKTRTLGSSKRRTRLSYEELDAQAEEAGVHELYEHAGAAFGSVLRRYTSTSGIGFNAQSTEVGKRSSRSLRARAAVGASLLRVQERVRGPCEDHRRGGRGADARSGEAPVDSARQPRVHRV